MKRNKDEQLIDCMSCLGLRRLPEKWDGKSFYLTAIVEIAKKDGSFGYAIQRTRTSGERYIWRDYGTSAGIYEIQNIYPCDFLQQENMFNGKKREEKVEFLKIRFREENEDFDDMSVKDLNKWILRAAIEQQYNKVL